MKLILFNFLIENREDSLRASLTQENVLQQAFEAPYSAHSETLTNVFHKATFFGDFYLMNTSISRSEKSVAQSEEGSALHVLALLSKAAEESSN